MKRIAIPAVVLALGAAALLGVLAQNAPEAPATAVAEAKETVCFEARKGATDVTQRELQPGLPNVKCSPTTGAALWYGDPFDGTVAMAKMPNMPDLPEGHAVIKPRTPQLKQLAACGIACHNGTYPKGYPTSKDPTPIPTMEALMPELKDFQHGRGGIWCLDCHHPTQRNKFVDNFGKPVSMDEPQTLCGKCHGDKLRDWRDGIHGKRIGDFTSIGKKRWFTCSECHNPHNVQDGNRHRGFAQLQPEPPPQLPKGMKSAEFEKTHPIAH